MGTAYGAISAFKRWQDIGAVTRLAPSVDDSLHVLDKGRRAAQAENPLALGRAQSPS